MTKSEPADQTKDAEKRVTPDVSQNARDAAAPDSETVPEPDTRSDFFKAGHGIATGETQILSPAERKARNKRNIAIALGVVTFAVLVYSITVLRLAQSIENRAPAGEAQDYLLRNNQ